MDCFAGLDVSVKDTSVCIVDDAGRIRREVKVASEPETLRGCCPCAASGHAVETAIPVTNCLRGIHDRRKVGIPARIRRLNVLLRWTGQSSLK
jgi:tRNA A37 threonylcarbamoyltransferase TsaD